MGTLIESASSAISQIGRHLSVTSLVPTLLFLLWLLALFSSDPWEVPNLAAVSTALTDWSVAKVVGMVAAAVTIGFVAHPLLFATTQLLEGYWGPHPLAIRVAAARAGIHRKRLRALVDECDDREARIDAFTTHVLRKTWSAQQLKDASPAELRSAAQSVLASEDGLPAFAEYIAMQAAARATTGFPDEGHRVMPTRLGNALRRIEDRTGRQYELDLVTIAPHLAVMARGGRAKYISDSREEFDFTVRLCSFALIASVVTTVWLAPTGWWLLLACIPYAVAYAAYRGAIAAAQEWGTALGTAVDLERFALYAALGLQLPADSEEERLTNQRLVELINGDATANVAYSRQAPRADS